MTREERRRLLGDAVVDHIHAEADAAIAEHPPTADVLDALRPILTAPARATDAAGEAQTAA